MDFITRHDTDIEHTEMFYGKSSKQYEMKKMLLDMEEQFKNNRLVKIMKLCKMEKIIYVFEATEDNKSCVMRKEHWTYEDVLKKQKEFTLNKYVSDVVNDEIYDLITKGYVVV